MIKDLWDQTHYYKKYSREKEGEDVKIVQISDIHCASSPIFLADKLKTAIREIKQINPEVVVISGDLTQNGFKDEMEDVKLFIDQIDCDKIITTMGNHDALFTGYIPFEEIFGPASGVVEGDEYKIVYVNTARPDKDEGRVGREQIDLIRREFENSDKFDILVMHHHLIPVPDTGLEQAIVEDAGDVLKIISSIRLDLVLSGHRHRPWRWKLNGTQFVFAGAVSTRRLRGFFENSYNIIEIDPEEETITPKLKVVGGPLLDFDTLIKYTGIYQCY